MESSTERNNTLLSISICTTNLTSKQWLVFASIYDFFKEFINIDQGVGGRGAEWGAWWQKLNQRRKKTQIVELRRVHTPTKTNIPLQGLDRRVLTVGAISRPHSQIGALLWHHFTSRGFTWLAQSIQGKQTSRL